MIDLTDFTLEVDALLYEKVCAANEATGVSPELYVLCFLYWIVEAYGEVISTLRFGNFDI